MSNTTTTISAASVADSIRKERARRHYRARLDVEPTAQDQSFSFLLVHHLASDVEEHLEESERAELGELTATGDAGRDAQSVGRLLDILERAVHRADPEADTEGTPVVSEAVVERLRGVLAATEDRERAQQLGSIMVDELAEDLVEDGPVDPVALVRQEIDLLDGHRKELEGAIWDIGLAMDGLRRSEARFLIADAVASTK